MSIALPGELNRHVLVQRPDLTEVFLALDRYSEYYVENANCHRSSKNPRLSQLILSSNQSYHTVCCKIYTFLNKCIVIVVVVVVVAVVIRTLGNQKIDFVNSPNCDLNP